MGKVLELISSSSYWLKINILYKSHYWKSLNKRETRYIKQISPTINLTLLNNGNEMLKTF